jgi:hypothetical protein
MGAALRAAHNVLWVVMGKFFSQNIDRRGRVVRAVWGAALIAVGLVILGHHPRICLGLVTFGVFALYEAARGWCLMRACGIKTKL